MSQYVGDLGAALRALDGHELARFFGGPTYARGKAYASQGRVSELRVAAPGLITATVAGSGGHRYGTTVRFDPSGTFRGGSCSCPVSVDCKHVLTVTLVAQRTLGLAGMANGLPRHPAGPGLAPAPSAPPVWERLLGGLLESDAQQRHGTPVGLVLEVNQPRSGPYAAGQVAPTISLRPVLPGKNGWIRSGISWQQLDYLRYGAAAPDPDQVAALLQVRSLSMGHRSYYSSSAPTIPLSQLGDSWASALRGCARAGVTLLTDPRHSGRVVVAPDAATFRLEVRRLQDAADDGAVGGAADEAADEAPERALEATPVIAPPASFPPEAVARDLVTVGAPPTGVWTAVGRDLYLAALDPPLTVDMGRLLDHGRFVVAPEEVTRFLTEVLPVLARRLPVVSPDGSVELAEVAPPTVVLGLTASPGARLELAWRWRYAVGERRVQVPFASSAQGGLRDAAAEIDLAEALVAVLPPDLVGPPALGRPPAPLPLALLTGYAVIDFLDRVVPVLEELGVEVELQGDEVAFVEATSGPTVRLSVTDTASDWFDLTVAVTLGDEHVPVADLVTALTRGDEVLILPSGTWFRLNDPALAQLKALLDEARALQDGPPGTLRLSVYQADLWAELEALGIVEEQSARWQGAVAALSVAGIAPVEPPVGLMATLRPYQLEGYSWMTALRRGGLGGILADDMGLGKTMQGLAMILQARAEDPASPPWLVVAPASVLDVWVREAAKFAPSLRVGVASTTDKRASGIQAVPEGVDLVVTSYAVFRLDAEAFAARAFSGLILDEAQAVKNYRGATYQCARKLEVPVKFAVTGTPMENNLMELWALLSIVAPGLFPKPETFTEHYRRPIETGAEPERLATLRRRIRPVMLRRTKALVADELPPKQEQVVWVELPPKHRHLYDRTLARERQRVLGLLQDADRNRIAIFRALTQLRLMSLHPGLVEAEHLGMAAAKIDTLVELLRPLLAEGHQVLVFSQFTSFLAMVRERLDAEGVTYAYLDGRTRKRAEAVARFTSGEAPVFLISLKAGGVGLTLTEADYVFLLDPWWNPAVEAQAVDRAHRIGQTRHVNVYRLVSANTIEDKVVALQERKRALFATVIDEGALASGALTAEDVRDLL